MTERMNGTGGDPALMKVEHLLREFYRAEMPAPWPRFNRPSQAPLRQAAPRFSQHFFRLALAASVVLAFLAYWGVAGLFPTDGVNGNSVSGPEIGLKNGHHAPSPKPSPVERMRTPGGVDIQLFEEGLPNGQGQVINIIGPTEPKSPR